MRRVLLASAALAAIVGATPASALIRYDFTALSSFVFDDPAGSVMGGWTYIAPTYVVGDADIPLADLVSCTAVSSLGPTSCTDQFFFASPAFGQADTVAIGFGTTNVEPLYYFADGAFSAPGTYNTTLFGTDQQGILVVTDLGKGTVPEPASWALMIVGFGLVGGAMRRRVALTA
jgi:hypothetical protein